MKVAIKDFESSAKEYFCGSAQARMNFFATFRSAELDKNGCVKIADLFAFLLEYRLPKLANEFLVDQLDSIALLEYACAVAELVLPEFEAHYIDKSAREALEYAQDALYRHKHNLATNENLKEFFNALSTKTPVRRLKAGGPREARQSCFRCLSAAYYVDYEKRKREVEFCIGCALNGAFNKNHSKEEQKIFAKEIFSVGLRLLEGQQKGLAALKTFE